MTAHDLAYCQLTKLPAAFEWEPERLFSFYVVRLVDALLRLGEPVERVIDRKRLAKQARGATGRIP